QLGTGQAAISQPQLVFLPGNTQQGHGLFRAYALLLPGPTLLALLALTFLTLCLGLQQKLLLLGIQLELLGQDSGTGIAAIHRHEPMGRFPGLQALEGLQGDALRLATLLFQPGCQTLLGLIELALFVVLFFLTRLFTFFLGLLPALTALLAIALFGL